MPPDDPLGRHGPSLDNFLRKKPLVSEPNRPLCPYGTTQPETISPDPECSVLILICEEQNSRSLGLIGKYVIASRFYFKVAISKVFM